MASGILRHLRKQNPINVQKTRQMDTKTVRSAITQAKYNESNGSVLTSEILLIAIGLGILYKSWWVFGGVLLGLFTLMHIPFLGTLFLLCLSLVLGVIGWAFGLMAESLGAQVVLALLGFLAGVGIHFSARQHLEDL